MNAMTMRPGVPAGLSHAAFVTHDTASLVEFYENVLGLELVAAVVDDAIPSTGDEVPYFHSFFRLGDGSTLAFFEAPILPPETEPSHPAYRVFNHFAMRVDSPAEVDAWREWLLGKGVDVLGPVDHKIIYSIYFHDPSGMRLEITAHTDPNWNDQPAAAKAAFAEWERMKAEAREQHRDLAAVVRDFAHERSRRHRRSAIGA